MKLLEEHLLVRRANIGGLGQIGVNELLGSLGRDEELVALSSLQATRRFVRLRDQRPCE